MILFKLMTKKKVNTDIRQNFTHSFVHDVKHFFAESDNRFKYWKNMFSRFFVLLIIMTHINNIMTHDYTRDTLLSLICILNIFSITFLSLDN